MQSTYDLNKASLISAAKKLKNLSDLSRKPARGAKKVLTLRLFLFLFGAIAHNSAQHAASFC